MNGSPARQSQARRDALGLVVRSQNRREYEASSDVSLRRSRWRWRWSSERADGGGLGRTVAGPGAAAGGTASGRRGRAAARGQRGGGRGIRQSRSTPSSAPAVMAPIRPAAARRVCSTSSGCRRRPTIRSPSRSAMACRAPRCKASASAERSANLAAHPAPPHADRHVRRKSSSSPIRPGSPSSPRSRASRSRS